jgi:hypothetical protein
VPCFVEHSIRAIGSKIGLPSSEVIGVDLQQHCSLAEPVGMSSATGLAGALQAMATSAIANQPTRAKRRSSTSRCYHVTDRLDWNSIE